MKKLSTIILGVAMLVCSCGGNKGGVSNDSLQGKYTVDISNAGAIIENEFKAEQIPTAMLSSLLSQLDLTVEFKDQKATIDAGTTVTMLLKTITQGKYNFPMTMDYKIEKDSILYLKPEDGNFKEAGIITKVDDKYNRVLYKPKYKSTNVTIELKREK